MTATNTKSKTPPKRGDAVRLSEPSTVTRLPVFPDRHFARNLVASPEQTGTHALKAAQAYEHVA